MENQSTTNTGQCSADPVFLFLPPVQADYPLTKEESETIARQASVARGWMVALGVRA
jgi:hypothetical protein